MIVNPTAVSTAINDDNSKSRLVVIFSVSVIKLSVIFWCSFSGKPQKNLNVIWYLIN